MPRRDWFGKLALAITLAGIVLALVAIGYGLGLEHWSKQNDVYYHHKENAERQRQQTAEEIAQTCERRAGTDLLSCLQEQVATHDREQATSEDLHAQQEMALWGLWVAIAAGFTAVLTGAGVYLIAETLAATKIAADHTKGMLDEATKTTKAALDSARYQRTAGRPFLTPVDYHLSWVMDATGKQPVVPRTYAFQMRVRNIGGSPAFMKSYGTAHFAGNGMPPSDLPIEMENALVGPWFVGADDTRDFDTRSAFLYIELTDEQLRKIWKCRLDLFVVGYLEYADSFGAVWRSRFCFEFIPKVVQEENLGISGSEYWWTDYEVSGPERDPGNP